MFFVDIYSTYFYTHILNLQHYTELKQTNVHRNFASTNSKFF